ncbi:hypothetical protein L914_12477 [Phytophthora nicotianae]|uniref:Uncharacterized protein n=1 Tax=Phytophthora nicotianae TaxID=4792 RepID=W2N1Q6_PHYNI|nr:hypothetical protein L914_12477 [Phytophthora nicotianae]
MPLMYAVKRNFVELARYLVLEAGAIVNKKYEMGVPELPLHDALTGESTQVVDYATYRS